MNLRSKLFLSIGALLVFLAIMMYLLPYFLVQENIEKASQELKSLVHNEEQDLVRTQQTLLARQFDEVEANVNSLLYLIYDASELRKTLSQSTSQVEILDTLARFLNYDPNIGLLQWTNLNSMKTLGIINESEASYFYQKASLVANVAIVSLNEELYFGVPLKEQEQAYLLFSPEEIWTFSSSSQNELAKNIIQIQKELQQTLSLTPLSSLEQLKKALTQYLEKEKANQQIPSKDGLENSNRSSERMDWTNHVRMIQALAPYVGESLQNQSFPLPIGFAKPDLLGRNIAILTKDVFRDHSEFDAVSYYQKHSKKNEPIANQPLFIQDLHNSFFYLVNLIELEDDQSKEASLITIGTRIFSFIKNLAMTADSWIIMSVNDHVDVGFADNGSELSREQLEEFGKKLANLNINAEQFPFLGHSFRVFKLSLEPKWKVKFFILTPQAKEKRVEETLVRLNDAISSRLSFHILLVALGSLIIALLVLARISLNITRPIAMLAKATEYVPEEKYEEIELPNTRYRYDEIATLTNSFREMIKGLKERKKILGVLNKVISKEVAHEILKGTIHLGGEDRIITMLFSDIRGFTKLSENLTPQEVISMLNTYMTKMSRIIESEGGCIDKYVGDEIVALYGAPVNHPNHAIQAISAAILMVERLRLWNKERAQANQPPVEMGIGIHTGLVVAGNMGAEDRLNYTVLGSSVNLTARLCGIAESMQILISESSLEEENVKQLFKYKELPSVMLKGFSEPIKIFQILGFEWK